MMCDGLCLLHQTMTGVAKLLYFLQSRYQLAAIFDWSIGLWPCHFHMRHVSEAGFTRAYTCNLHFYHISDLRPITALKMKLESSFITLHLALVHKAVWGCLLSGLGGSSLEVILIPNEVCSGASSHWPYLPRGLSSSYLVSLVISYPVASPHVYYLFQFSWPHHFHPNVLLILTCAFGSYLLSGCMMPSA